MSRFDKDTRSSCTGRQWSKSEQALAIYFAELLFAYKTNDCGRTKQTRMFRQARTSRGGGGVEGWRSPKEK